MTEYIPPFLNSALPRDEGYISQIIEIRQLE